VGREIITRLWALIEPILEPENIELVDLEFKLEGGRWVLRVFIDTTAGVTLTECETASRQISALLDMEDPIEHPYVLEVSSPGINRILRKEKDFIMFSGSPVRIRTRRKLNGQRNFSGILKGLQNSRIMVDMNGISVEIDLHDLEKATLDLPEEDLFRRDLRRKAATAGD
jgi:ribosome maturation factor RimP